MIIWGWMEQIKNIPIWGDEYSFSSYFGLHQGSRILTDDPISIFTTNVCQHWPAGTRKKGTLPSNHFAFREPDQQGDMLLFGELMRHFNPSLQCLLYLDDTGNKQVGFLGKQTISNPGRNKADSSRINLVLWNGPPGSTVLTMMCWHRRCDADIGLQTR